MKAKLGACLVGLLMTACGGKVDDRGLGGSKSLAGEGTDSGVPADASPGTPTTPTLDAGPGEDGSAVGIAGACGGSDLGATRPGELTLFDFQLSLVDCPTCYALLTVRGPCQVESLLKPGDPRSATMTAADCLAVTSWLTSDQLLNAVDTGALCSGSAGPAFPPTFIDLDVGGKFHGYKSSTPECHGALLPRHYACMKAILDTYFPGAKLVGASTR